MPPKPPLEPITDVADGTIHGDFDPFLPEQDRTTYRPENVYIHSTNRHDHSTVSRFRYPPHWSPFINEVVNLMPKYRSVSDLVRDAIFHRVRYIAEHYQMSDEFKRWQEDETRLANVQRTQARRALAKKQVSTMRQAVEEAYSEGDIDELYDLLEQAAEWVDTMPKPYRQQIAGIYEDYMGRAKRMRA